MEYICNENVCSNWQISVSGPCKIHQDFRIHPFPSLSLILILNYIILSDLIPPIKISTRLIYLYPFIVYKYHCHTFQPMKTFLLHKKNLKFVFTFIKIMPQINHLLCHPVHCSKNIKIRTDLLVIMIYKSLLLKNNGQTACLLNDVGKTGYIHIKQQNLIVLSCLAHKSIQSGTKISLQTQKSASARRKSKKHAIG